MASGPSPQLDLQALAAKANRKLAQQQTAHQAALARSQRPGYLRRFSVALAISVTAVLVLLNLSVLRASVGWVSDASRDADIKLVLESARKAVEEHRHVSGELPPRVPLPALDALVVLQRTPTGYRLATQMNGRVAVMNEDGSVSIQGLN